jgi:hypothetical protein
MLAYLGTPLISIMHFILQKNKALDQDKGWVGENELVSVGSSKFLESYHMDTLTYCLVFCTCLRF